MKKLSMAVLGVVLAMVALTGCQSPKAMAYVNGTQVSAQQYEQTVAGLNELGQPLTPEDRGGVATNLIQFEIVRQLGADLGITIPQDQQDAALADQVSQAAQAGVELKGGSLEYYRQYTEATLLIQKAGQEAAAKALQSAEVKLNPKYGAWGPDQQGSMVALPGKGSLSSSAAQPR